MHDILLEYDEKDLPSGDDIFSFFVPSNETYHIPSAHEVGQVLMKVKCKDGTVIIIRKNYKTTGCYETRCHE
jgi:hypothetical protein